MTTNTRLPLLEAILLLGAILLLLPVAALLLLLPVAALGQVPVGTEAVAAGLTTHGHAELKVRPDIAHFSVSVTTQARQQAAAAQDNARRTTALVAALKGAGIADKDIETSDYSIQPQYNDKPSPPVLTGYQVTNSIDVTVRDLSRVGTVLDQATGAGATNIDGVSYDLADRTGAERQALAQAVTEAQAKAGAMAQAAGISLGRLLSLGEGGPVVVQPLEVSRAMVAAAAPEAAPPTPVEARLITVAADCTAVYALGP